MNINLASEIAHIETTENYTLGRIAEITIRYTNFSDDALVNISEEYTSDIARLEAELECARVRSQIANAVINSRSVIVLK